RGKLPAHFNAHANLLVRHAASGKVEPQPIQYILERDGIAPSRPFRKGKVSWSQSLCTRGSKCHALPRGKQFEASYQCRFVKLERGHGDAPSSLARPPWW